MKQRVIGAVPSPLPYPNLITLGLPQAGSQVSLFLKRKKCQGKILPYLINNFITSSQPFILVDMLCLAGVAVEIAWQVVGEGNNLVCAQ